MSDLSTNLRAFVDEMRRNKEAADYGFAALTKRGLFGASLYAEIRAAGLLSASENPGPAPAKKEGYVHIPYWPALDYLEGVAKHSKESNDIALGKMVAETIIDVSTSKDDPRGRQDNYHTNRKLAEIIAKLPSDAINDDLIAQVRSWISSVYDRGMVVAVIGESLLPRLLGEDDARHHKQALMLFDFGTTIQWKPDNDNESAQEPEFIADPYWLKELLKNNVEGASRRLGIDFVEMLRFRLQEIYGKGTRVNASWLSRPAIEEHAQNHEWDDIDNLIVVALRDALSILVDQLPNDHVLEKLAQMYASGVQIERRIAIHIFDKKFTQTLKQILASLDAGLLDDGCLHEAYWFLKNHFSELPLDKKELLFAEIENLAPEKFDPESDEHSGVWMQRRWLNAIQGQGYEEADRRLANIVFHPKMQHDPEYPDFYAYMTSWSGPGPSQFTTDELLWFLDQGELATKLNAFEPKGNWPLGPSRRALVDALEAAIKQQPVKFMKSADLALKLQRPYQYAVFSAFKSLWNANGEESAELNWEKTWQTLFELADAILTADFWAEPEVDDETLTPTRSWIPPIIAELVKDGTRNDAHAFSPKLLPMAQKVLANILGNLQSEPENLDRDPMSRALNSSRGKAIEALFLMALRSMRIADQENQDRQKVWATLEPMFEDEILRTDNGNFEFSTLAANYCAQLLYLNESWFDLHKTEILSPKSEANFSCAIAGLAYAHANKRLYGLLAEVGAIARAIATTNLPEKSRDRIIERVVLAYLWEQETLDSPVLLSLFDEGRLDDLDTAIAFMWSIHNQELSARQIELLLEFWRFAVQWSLEKRNVPAKILGGLANLICYVTQLNDDDANRLLSLAPYANVNHTSYHFVEHLERLLAEYPQKVAEISLAYLKANGPEYDYQNRWLCITTAIADRGLRDQAITIAEIMRKQPGFDELYRRIR